jgi:hypothetical protein
MASVVISSSSSTAAKPDWGRASPTSHWPAATRLQTRSGLCTATDNMMPGFFLENLLTIRGINE